MYDIKKISEAIDGKIIGDDNLVIAKLSPFFESSSEDVTFAADEKMLKNLKKTKAQVIIVPDLKDLPVGKTYIIVNRNPREVMPILLNFFKRKFKKMDKPIEISAKISKVAKISKINTYIGHDVIIGDGTEIYPNVAILQGVKIGKNCIIYPNVTIREFVEIGDNVILQPGCVVGSDGFGYVKIDGKNIKIEQIGSVILEDDVELGANTCVDRGTIGDTIIKKGTKIDNLVQIAHNDIIGENCLMISQSGAAGSVKIGNNTIIAGQVGIAGHLEVGDNVIIGARSGVTKDIPSNSKVSGFPLRDHREDLKIKIASGKLPELLKRVKKLEDKIK